VLESNYPDATEQMLQIMAQKVGLRFATAPRGIPTSSADILFDRGDFGWEPSIYLLAPALEILVQRVDTLVGMLNEGE
jgi:predicted fused transcriptional regulator/phosphomethylpyrimidine kinase